MRIVLVVLCALLIMNFSLEAKVKQKVPASQKTAAAKQHRAMVKQYQKAHKAPKHRQKVN